MCTVCPLVLYYEKLAKTTLNIILGLLDILRIILFGILNCIFVTIRFFCCSFCRLRCFCIKKYRDVVPQTDCRLQVYEIMCAISCLLVLIVGAFVIAFHTNWIENILGKCQSSVPEKARNETEDISKGRPVQDGNNTQGQGPSDFSSLGESESSSRSPDPRGLTQRPEPSRSPPDNQGASQSPQLTTRPTGDPSHTQRPDPLSRSTNNPTPPQKQGPPSRSPNNSTPPQKQDPSSRPPGNRGSPDNRSHLRYTPQVRYQKVTRTEKSNYGRDGNPNDDELYKSMEANFIEIDDTTATDTDSRSNNLSVKEFVKEKQSMNKVMSLLDEILSNMSEKKKVDKPVT